jgi:predicted transport protein
MILYSNQADKLKPINEKPFKLEKDIQKLFEGNLSVLMGLELVKSEFVIKSRRIDTLAFDKQTNGFVIIEYKRDRNVSVIDQGFSYLSLMLENKSEFLVEYNESLSRNLKRDEIDWSQSRVAFVSPNFTENQKMAVNFQDVAIELWEVKRYENDSISFNQIRKTSKESIKQIADPQGDIDAVAKEIIVYKEEDHLAKGSDAIQELYENIKNRILELDGLEMNLTKFYIGFKLNNKVVTDVEIQKNSMKHRINLKKGQLDDPKGLFTDVSEKGHWGLGDYETKYDTDVDIDYLMSLVKQSYSYFKKN